MFGASSSGRAEQCTRHGQQQWSLDRTFPRVQPTIFFSNVTNSGTITIDTGAAVTFEGTVSRNPASRRATNLQPNASAKFTSTNSVLVVGGLEPRRQSRARGPASWIWAATI